MYYILRVHGQGRTIVFCTSIAALRHISSLLRILGVNVWTLHAQMQQRARLKVSLSLKILPALYLFAYFFAHEKADVMICFTATLVFYMFI